MGILLAFLWLLTFACAAVAIWVGCYGYGKKQRCSLRVLGTVEDYVKDWHRFRNVPLVHYQVEGQEYWVKGPDYRRVHIERMRSDKQTVSFTETRILRQTLHFSYQAPDDTLDIDPFPILFPKGRKITVYYNPKKPQDAYVLRFCDNRSTLRRFGLLTLFFMLVSILLMIVF